jgi:hypothetical protein
MAGLGSTDTGASLGPAFSGSVVVVSSADEAGSASEAA